MIKRKLYIKEGIKCLLIFFGCIHLFSFLGFIKPSSNKVLALTLAGVAMGILATVLGPKNRKDNTQTNEP